MLLHFEIPFKLIYFDPILVSGVGGGGVCSQNICYHVTAFLILINLIYFDLLTLYPGSGGGGGLQAK